MIFFVDVAYLHFNAVCVCFVVFYFKCTTFKPQNVNKTTDCKVLYVLYVFFYFRQHGPYDRIKELTPK